MMWEPAKASARAGLACLCLAVITSVSASDHLDDGDLKAISTFLAKQSFDRPVDRKYALSSIKPLNRFNFLEQLPSVRFYVYPTAASTFAGHVALAIDDHGQVFDVGEEAEFNRLIRAMDLIVSDPNQANRLARDYLRLRYIHAEVWEGVDGGVNLIGSVDDIPFVKDKIDQEVERFDLLLNHQVKPPTTERSDVGFLFRGDSWGPFDGAVAEHLVTIHKDGTIEYRLRPIAYAYGDYKTGCSFPLDSGPTIDTLARLAHQPDSRARVVVATYIRFLTRSDFMLHRKVLEENRSELREIAQVLAQDSDPGVERAGVEALDALEVRDEAR